MFLCRNCGMGRVPDMDAHKPDFWVNGSPDEELSKEYWTTLRSGMFTKALIHLETTGGTGRIVDIGGGLGYFAELALSLGWDAYSVDVSELAQKAAAERLGPDRSLTHDQAKELAGTCDVVTLWCVIAHVLNPMDLVREAADLLKPGGRMLITTPNFIFQGALARTMALLGKPYDLVSRDHVFHFTPSAIDRLLGDAGLESWTFEYLGVTDNCILSSRFARVFVPLKRVWNYAGTRTPLVGLPPVCGELQIVGVKAQSQSESRLAG